MDEATTGNGRVLRLLARVLLVLGGAVLTTAAAWLLSTATASADTLDGTTPIATPNGITSPLDTAPVHALTDRLTGPIGSVVDKSVPTSLPSQVAPLSKVAADSTAGITEVTGRLGSAMKGAVDRIPAGGVASAPLPVRLPGSLTHLAADPTAPAAPALTAPAQRDPVLATPVHLGYRHPGSPAAGTARPSASTAPTVGQPTTPSAPGLPVPQPFSPVTAPAPAGSSGNSGPQSRGGVSFGDPSGRPMLPGLHLVGVCAPATPLPPVRTGRQPGITPD